jgi:peptide/nickel transport system ATP-binding protein
MEPVNGPVLEVVDLKKHFAVGGRLMGHHGFVYAVDGVSFSIEPGEFFGLVGESGSGKTTVGNCITRLLEPTAGVVRLNGTDVTHLSRRQMRPLRREVHIVFQDPYSSLNPRMTCGQIVGEPLRLHRIARRRELSRRVAEIFDQVGLRADLRYRYPHELSGGQRQRVGLARALILNPSLLIADEPVSALDVSVQAQILNLFSSLRSELGLGYLFITHDLAVVRQVVERVYVLYRGEVVESGPVDRVLDAPEHPYTAQLVESVPRTDPGWLAS